jgi:LysR family hydrogen peroxide-inducible transcriptional activator
MTTIRSYDGSVDMVLLRSFLEIAAAGSISRAARRLGVSQPSLTAQVQRLERQLEVTLFARHGRGITLTEAGAALRPRAERLLEALQATADAVRRERPAGDRPLVVGAIPTIAPYLLPAACQRWRGHHASVRVILREAVSAELAGQLQAGALDLVIAALPYAFDAFETESLGVDPLVVAVPASHAAARAGRISLAQLQDAPAIALDPAHCLGAQVDGFCASRGVTPRVVCHGAQLATVLELVGAGMGVSIVPAMAAARHNSPSCAYVALAEQPLEREIVAVWRRGGECAPAARAFVQCVREALRGW